MIRLLHESARRLKPYRRSAAVLGCARLLLKMICLFSSLWLQNEMRRSGLLRSGALSAMPNGSDLFLAGSLLLGLTGSTPLRMQSDWQIGRLSGTLDENDLGFLSHCSSFWLWCRAFGARLLMQTVILLSAMPALLLGFAAKCIWLALPAEEESILPLMTVLHLGILAFAALLLPLRCLAAASALPYVYLKSPHEPPHRNLRLAFRLTRGQTAEILLTRLILQPMLLFPFSAARMIPVLLAAEQLRCANALRHLEPHSRTKFSGFELHAYEEPAM